MIPEAVSHPVPVLPYFFIRMEAMIWLMPVNKVIKPSINAKVSALAKFGEKSIIDLE